LPTGHEKFSVVASDLVDVPRIVSKEIGTSCLAGVLCNQSLIPK